LVWLGFDGGLFCGGDREVAGRGFDDDAELFGVWRDLLGIVESFSEITIARPREGRQYNCCPFSLLES
jgi:hypothetical protein